MLPTEFLVKSIPLHWADLLWGCRNKLIDWRVPVEIAGLRVGTEASNNDLENQLAHTNKDYDWEVSRILKELAYHNYVAAETSKKKWLYLKMLWLYENQNEVVNLFDRIGEIYADFDYPDEIRSFVPFMPPDDDYDPMSHSLAENYSRILRKWKQYLEITEANIASLEG